MGSCGIGHVACGSLAVRLGGRAAEIVVLAEPSTASASDLAGATDLARHIRGHRQTLDRVIDVLLERETIDGSDLAAIVGARSS
jgi:ATP-dependent Zn protease